MKKLAGFLLPLLFSAATSFAQVELCQGAFWTEAQGATFLENHLPVSIDAWQLRAEEIRKHLRDGMELQAFPPIPTSSPMVTGKRTMDGYTVENIAFESIPGFYVTGNLYRPTKKQKSYAGILSPHGHWSDPDGRE